MSRSPENDEAYSDEEAARRRDEVVRTMLNTPPKPHKAAPAKAEKSKRGRPRKSVQNT